MPEPPERNSTGIEDDLNAVHAFLQEFHNRGGRVYRGDRLATPDEVAALADAIERFMKLLADLGRLLPPTDP
jgi:hypothetical protein